MNVNETRKARRFTFIYLTVYGIYTYKYTNALGEQIHEAI